MAKVFEKIISSAPVDALARRVTSSGARRTGPIRMYVEPYDTHLPIPLLPKRLYPWHASHFRNFTGTRLGRLVVLGISADRIRTKVDRVKWVVRCSCGTYSLRGTMKLRKALRNPEEHMCGSCKAKESYKRTERWKMTGVDQS